MVRAFICTFILLYTLHGQCQQSDQEAIELLESIHGWTYHGDSSRSSVIHQLVKFYTSSTDTCKLIRSLLLRSSIGYKSDEYDLAFQDILKAQKLFANTKCDVQTQALIGYANARFYRHIGEAQKADSIAAKTIDLFKPEWTDKTTLVKLYFIRDWLQDDELNSLTYMEDALEICRLEGLPVLEQKVLVNIGTHYAIAGEMVEAKNYFIQALPLARKLDSKRDLSILFNNLAGLSTNAEEQLNYIDSAIFYARKEQDTDRWLLFTINKANAYKDNGNFESGYYALYKSLHLKDSVFKERKIEAISELEKKYETEKKAKEIQKLKVENLNSEVENLTYRRNQTNLIFGGASLLILALLLAYGFINVRKNRNTLAKKNVEIEEAHEVSESLLLNILPADIAEELKIHGKAEAREIDMVGILFTDFKSFTQTSEKLSAKELVNEINTCFEAFDHICEKYQVEKIKTIGDAYMAAGGLPVHTDDSIKNTVLAALAMQAFMVNRKQKNEAHGLPAFEMRAGIHTGPVVAGIVGVKKFQYDIWGDTVNTASRMESNGEVGKVNISQPTYDLLKDDDSFTFESRGKIKAKGKGEMEMYFVNQRK